MMRPYYIEQSEQSELNHIYVEPIVEPTVNVAPPNIILQGETAIGEEISLLKQRLRRFDFLFVYIVILLVDILFLLSYIPGIYSSWNTTLVQANLHPWIPRAGWIVATILSYIGIYILWEYAGPDDIPRDLGVSVLFIVGSLITVAWSVALYQGQNIALSTWISVILFVFQFWLVIYVWFIKPLAALFLIPLMLMYLYLVYSMVHLAAINGVVL
jgi:tryptophan-rich sensory protein